MSNFCAIGRMSTFFEEKEDAPRGNFLKSGGSWATSLSLFGTAVANSFGLGGGAGETPSSQLCFNSSVFSTRFELSLLFDPVAWPTLSCLAALRSMARAVCIADLTSGRRSSSTRLFHPRKRVAYKSDHDHWTYLLKCCRDSPGWMTIDTFPA
jgi:hypothetical protein